MRAVAAYIDGAFYVVTYSLSGKMQQIARNPTVAISGEWFTAHGYCSSVVQGKTEPVWFQQSFSGSWDMMTRQSLMITWKQKIT